MGSLITLRARNSASGDLQSEYDLSTQETVTRISAAILDEDFLGAGHLPAFPTSPTAGYPWVAKLVKTTGAPSVGVVANFAGGAASCALDATSEDQEAILYAGDQLNWDPAKSAIFECRLAMSVLPGAANVEAVFGLHSAYVAGPDNTATYIDFQMLGSGAINARIKDGVSGAQSVASGVTLLAGVFHVFRFDASDPTNVQFFIDGTKLSPVAPAAPMTFAATGAVMQPYFEVYKPTGTGLATLQVDMVQLGMNRS